MECKIIHSNQEYVKKLESNINRELKNKNVLNSNNNVKIALQWGKMIEHDIRNDYVCNPNSSLNNIKNRIRMFRILKLNGIDIPSINITGEIELGKTKYIVEKVNTIRNYRIFVFQFKTLIMYRSTDNLVWLSQNASKLNIKYYEVAEDENKETKRIARLAERAIYSLGLDFGSVWVGITSGNKKVVLNVDSAPKLNTKREKLYREACVDFITQYIQDKETTDPIIGADPEFMFKDRKGKMILASKYFSKNGKVGCDARTFNRNKVKHPLGEIRPEPSSDPEQVVKNIKNIIHDAAIVVNSKNISWIAGSMPFKGYSIGGHIHFSNVKLNTPIARVLDNYLAVPLSLIENPATAKQRRLKYGFLGDVRTQFHGGFEYRTLSSWVVCPKISSAVLHLSRFIVEHYANLRTDVFETYSEQKMFYTVNRVELKKIFNELWDELEQIPEFHTLQKHISIIPDMISKNQIWNEKADFKINWNKSYTELNKKAKSS